MNHLFETDTPRTVNGTGSRRPRRALVSLLLALPITAGAGVLVAQAATPEPATATSGTADAPLERAVSAFYEAGYTFTDAETIAAAWDLEPYDAKVKAGREVIDGNPVPVQPSGLPGLADGVSRTEAVQAYVDAGYTDQDQAALSEAWGGELPAGDVKVVAGEKLILGQQLPVQPAGLSSAAAQGADADPDDAPQADAAEAAEAVAAFREAGYTYADVETIAAAWDLEPYDAKVKAGRAILDGNPVPVLGEDVGVEPSGEPVDGAPVDADQYVDAFFDAGYTYADAEELAALWSSATPYDAKVLAGTKLVEGIELPIQP